MSSENEAFAAMIKVMGAVVRKLKLVNPEYVVDVIFLYLKMRKGCELGICILLPDGLPNPALDATKFVDEHLDDLLADMSESKIVKSVQIAQAQAVIDDANAAAQAAAAKNDKADPKAKAAAAKKAAKSKPKSLDAIGDACATKTSFLQLVTNTIEYMRGRIDTASVMKDIVESFKFVILKGGISNVVELWLKGAMKVIESLLTVTRTNKVTNHSGLVYL